MQEQAQPTFGFRHLGYYTRADQPRHKPTFNPPLDAPCPICGRPLTKEDMRTISVMLQGGTRSYFYRTHRTCHQALAAEEAQDLDDAVIALITRHS